MFIFLMIIIRPDRENVIKTIKYTVSVRNMRNLVQLGVLSISLFCLSKVSLSQQLQTGSLLYKTSL